MVDEIDEQISSGNNKNRSDEEDRKELSSLHNILGGGSSSSSSSSSGNKTGTGSGSSGSVTTTMMPQITVDGNVMTTAPVIAWTKPSRVVKKVIRSIHPDGSETIEIRYLMSEDDVTRVMKERIDKERNAKKTQQKQHQLWKKSNTNIKQNTNNNNGNHEMELESEEAYMTLKVGKFRGEVREME